MIYGDVSQMKPVLLIADAKEDTFKHLRWVWRSRSHTVTLKKQKNQKKHQNTQYIFSLISKQSKITTENA